LILKNKAALTILMSALILLGGTNQASACTDFLVKATDGSCVVGRSMEWGLDLASYVWLYPRGEERSSEAPGGKSGLKWTSKYGYLTLDCHNMPIAVDGMNEKGLSVGLLWLPGTVYQDVPADHPEVALSMVDIGHWMLGEFTTVEQVKEAMKGVRVWAPSLADWGGNPTAHISIHDADGHSAVIEFVDGQQKIYDNDSIRVLTNAPTFDWHRTNIRNYIKLSPESTRSVTLGGTVLNAPGQGGGFLGIPGDWTPPSRFVRTTAMLGFAKPASNATEGVSLAVHLLNAVDIPLGTIRENNRNFEHSDYTQWIDIKDLKNQILYFRSYENSTLRAIDMKKLKFDSSVKAHRLTPVAGGNPAIDVTSQEPVK
jgi:choloylglycine hydrolase